MAQESRAHTFFQSITVGGEYSSTSSHLVLGEAQNRRLAGLDITLSHHIFHLRDVDWNYDLLVTPVTLVRDPVATIVVSPNGTTPPSNIPENSSGPVERACISGTYQAAGYSYTQSCGTRWTYAGGVSPLGQRLNFLPGRRLQPMIVANGGFLFATRNLPSYNAARLNFIFDLGAGLEFFTANRHSVVAEYRIQHLSNAGRGQSNPGFDNQIVRISYRFGR